MIRPFLTGVGIGIVSGAVLGLTAFLGVAAYGMAQAEAEL